MGDEQKKVPNFLSDVLINPCNMKACFNKLPCYLKYIVVKLKSEELER